MCVFVCSLITQKQLSRLSSNLPYQLFTIVALTSVYIYPEILISFSMAAMLKKLCGPNYDAISNTRNFWFKHITKHEYGRTETKTATKGWLFIIAIQNLTIIFPTTFKFNLGFIPIYRRLIWWLVIPATEHQIFEFPFWLS